MLKSRKLIICVALGTLASCGGVNSSNTRIGTVESREGPAAPDVATQLAEVEDVYVVRSRFSSLDLPVTPFCDAAQFPADYPVERERHYDYWSTGQSKEGLLVDANVQRLGGHHGCYSVNKNRMIYSYMTGTLAGITFTARGSCIFNPDRAPQLGVRPYTCNYVMSDLAAGYVGGQSTWNGVTTDIPGYLTTTIGSIRLWRGPQPAR